MLGAKIYLILFMQNIIIYTYELFLIPFFWSEGEIWPGRVPWWESSCWTVSPHNTPVWCSDAHVVSVYVWVHYRQSQTHLNSMCRDEDWFFQRWQNSYESKSYIEPSSLMSSFIHTPIHKHRNVLTRRLRGFFLLLYGPHVKQRKTQMRSH